MVLPAAELRIVVRRGGGRARAAIMTIICFGIAARLPSLSFFFVTTRGCVQRRGEKMNGRVRVLAARLSLIACGVI